MEEQLIIRKALNILESRIKIPEVYFSASKDVKNYMALRFGSLEYEVFSVMYLDSKNGLIKLKEMFRGTVDQNIVFCREILKTAIQLNATKVILVHNHPSGDPTPSDKDIKMTESLYLLLDLIQIKVLDHIIIAGAETYSLAENGQIITKRL